MEGRGEMTGGAHLAARLGCGVSEAVRRVRLQVRSPLRRPEEADRSKGNTGGGTGRSVLRWVRGRPRLAALVVLAALLIAGGAVFASAAMAATYTVNSTGDADSDGCGDDVCTLREAVNAAGSGDTVNFNLPAGSTITLAGNKISIGKYREVTIDGSGVPGLAVSGNNSTPLFYVDTYAALSIKGLKLTGGRAPAFNDAGAIWNFGGTVALTNVTVSGNSAPSSFGGGNAGAILNSRSPERGGTLTLTNVTVSGNSAYNGGGAIFNTANSTVTVAGSTITNNSATSAEGLGGAIFNDGGTVEVEDGSTITGNSASRGGAIYNRSYNNDHGRITVADSTLKGNTSSLGGAIYNASGTVEVTSSTVGGGSDTDRNSADRGGGLYNAGTATISSTTISGNRATGPDKGGGGIYNTGTLTLSNDTFSQNSAANRGGGLYNDGGTATVKDATAFANNSAANGGGIFNDGSGRTTLTGITFKSNTASNDGGGIHNLSGTTEVTDSTIGDSNTASNDGGGVYNGGTLTVATSKLNGNAAITRSGDGGGLYNAGTATISNTTISGNTADRDYVVGAGHGGGGGIYNRGTVTVVGSTINHNRTTSSSGRGAGLYNYTGAATLKNSTVSSNFSPNAGGGIYNTGDFDNTGTVTRAAVTLANSTLTDNDTHAVNGGGGLRVDQFSEPANLRNSILTGNRNGDIVGPYDSQGGNLIGGDARLGPLQNNGGPTQTHALLPGSPAYNAGEDALVPADVTTDQRGPGYPRKRGRVDIGAFEVQNDAPTASPRSAATNEETPVTITLSGSDPNGDSVTYSVTSQPSKGTLGQINGNTVAYTPDRDKTGSDSFTYRANDPYGPGGTATVSVEITPVNDPPTFTKGADQTVDEDAGAQSVSGWAKDIGVGPGDESSQSVSFAVTGNTEPGLFSSGPQLSPDGTLTYTPAPDRNGTATVTVAARDDGGTANGGDDEGDPQTFTITVRPVNDAPSFTAAGDQTVDEDSSGPNDPPGSRRHTVAGWISTFTPGPSDESAQQVDDYLVTVTGGSDLFAPGGRPDVSNDGALSYMLAENAGGRASFEVKVRDNGGTDRGGSNTSSPKSFAVTVNNTNDAPTVALSGPPSSASEGETKTYAFTVTDPDPGDTFTVATAACGTGGTLVEGSLSTTSTGGSFQCRFPDGPASPEVRLQVRDAQGAQSNVATQTVAITNVKPSVTLTGPATVEESATAQRGYTFNVTDPGDDAFSVEDGYPSCGANGTLVGGSLRTDADGGSFECRFPDGPATSGVAIKVRDSDGAVDADDRTVRVTISNVAPGVEFTSGDATASEGETRAYAFTVTDEGAGDRQTVTTSCGEGGQKVQGSDAFDRSTGEGSFECRFPDGPDQSTVSVEADDGGGTGRAQKTVEVANVRPSVTLLSGPATVEESATAEREYAFSVTDPGDDDFSVADGYPSCGAAGEQVPGSLSTTAGGGSFECRFPDGPATSGVAIKVRDSDGAQDADERRVEVTVDNVAPSANLEVPELVDEGAEFGISLSGATDPAGAGDSFEYRFKCGEGDWTPYGASSSHTCPAVPDGPGSVEVSGQVRDEDGGQSRVRAATVAVSNVKPSISLSGPDRADEATAKTYAFAVTDPGEDTHTVSTGCGANGQKVDGSEQYDPRAKEGSFRCYFPDGPATTDVTVKVTDSDGAADTDDRRVEVVVDNLAPSAGDVEVSTNEDVRKKITLSGADPAADPLSFTIVSLPEHGSLYEGEGTAAVRIAAPGARISGSVVTYLPNADYNGSDSFTYNVSDGDATSDDATVSIGVTAVNDAPKADDDTASTAEDTPLVFEVSKLLANDSRGPADEGEQALGIREVRGAAHGEVRLEGGKIVFTPGRDYNGAARFEYLVCDDGRSGGQGDPKCSEKPGVVRVSVRAVNDAPVARNDHYRVMEDRTLVVSGPGVLRNDSDVERDRLRAIKASNPRDGRITLRGNGSLVYEPKRDFSGVDSFRYRVTDGRARSGVVTVKIRVRPVRDADGPGRPRCTVGATGGASGAAAGDVSVVCRRR